MNQIAKLTNTQALNVALANARQRLSEANACAVECGERLGLAPDDPVVLGELLTARQGVTAAQEIVRALEASADAARAKDARETADERHALRKKQSVAATKAYSALEAKAAAVDALVGKLTAAFADLSEAQSAARALALGYVTLTDLESNDHRVLRDAIVSFGHNDLSNLVFKELFRLRAKLGLSLTEFPTHVRVRDDDTVKSRYVWVTGKIADTIAESEAKHEL